ncbi:hypothetical protein [Longimicrobium sp.]|uniref:hypothetical protein n=1 Tax=Longimicrobium sp. TaxID=2029185 RepID=UPI002CABDD3A|nr:hypothetical protein [Longimicrobium sp.]HSU12607.1 hypothetical protein [Longimicrobium sp.]
MKTICLTAAAVVAFAACGNSQQRAAGTAGAFSTVRRADGVTARYFAAGDPFLEAGYRLSAEYWEKTAGPGEYMLRGAVDAFVPPVFQAMQHEGADRMMRGFATSFFGAAAGTGLVPFAYDTRLEDGTQTGGRQPVQMIDAAMRFVRWFPRDTDIQRRARAMGDATLRSFDRPGGGVYGWAVASTGRPEIPRVYTAKLAAALDGMEALSEATGDPRYARWAMGKLAWVRGMRGPGTTLVCGDFTITARVPVDNGKCDTDLLYLTQRVYAIARRNGDAGLRAWALGDTEAWMTGGWLARPGHFARKLYPNGTPAVTTLYGDGKYNTLAVLVDGYRATRDARYLARLKTAWRGLRAMGRDGLAPEMVENGRMVQSRGLDPSQTIFLQILVDAYVVSGDREFLDLARELGTAILRHGRSAMRMDSGQAGDAFVRLGLASAQVHRVEVALPAGGARVTVVQGGRTMVDVAGPGAAAVVYLVPGVATLRTAGGARVVSDRVIALRTTSAD